MRTRLLAAALLAAAPSPAFAQPADLPIPAATTSHYPPGIGVAKVAGKAYYVDAAGHILYGMDMRVLLRAGPNPALYCKDDCAKTWQPVLAPAGTEPDIAFPIGFGDRNPAATVTLASGKIFYKQPQKAPDWTVIAGPQGPQWVYKGWHMVFTRRAGDARSPRYDGTEAQTWNTLKFVPPEPTLVAPPNVRATVVDGTFVLADAKGGPLFTGACAKDCASWKPFAAGMASAGLGEWTVRRDGDRAQWAYRGEPVFENADDPATVPAGSKVLRP